MSPQASLGLFIFLIVVLGIAWVVTGGPSRSISHEGPFLDFTPPSEGSVPSVGGTGSGDTDANTPNENDSGSGSFGNFVNGIFQAGEKADSPYAASVSLEVGGAKKELALEYVVIKTSSKMSGTVPVSEWSVESGTSKIKVKVGPAALIPFLGQVNVEAPFWVGPKTIIYATTARPPNGTSFRANICTGYFEQFQDFTPKLQISCPTADDEAVRVGNQEILTKEECVNFLDTIKQCEYRSTDTPANVGSVCQNFILNDLSYTGCIHAHKNDPNFYINEWRTFLKRDQELWKNTHDTINLRDENGKLIDSVRY